MQLRAKKTKVRDQLQEPTAEERLAAMEMELAQQAEVLNILVSGETEETGA
jgi:uncharacterized coiled-coil protein SlyX